MSGQAIWSFAAFDRLSKVGRWCKSSFRRAGSIAILTASSKRLNSASVIALSEFSSAGILSVRIKIVPQLPTRHCGLGLSLFNRCEGTRKRIVCVKIVFPVPSPPSDNQDAHDPLLIGGDCGQAGWQADRDPGGLDADGFAARSLARHRSAATYR